jgi:hypothetical protein
MSIGNKILLFGVILAAAVFVLSYEYLNEVSGGLGETIALFSLIIIVIGALLSYKSRPSKS